MFSLLDPFQRKLILTKHRWRDHIIVRHPIMKRLKKQLQETIKTPNRIYQSKINKDTQLYFKEYRHQKYGRFYLMAVVGFDREKKKGYIKTSFPVYNLKKGAQLVWKKS